jgi:hypothetical protein
MSTPPGMTTMPRASICGACSGDVVDDLAVAQADVAHLAVDAVGGVVDAPAGDAERHAAASRAARALGDRREHLRRRRALGRERRRQRDRHAVEPVHDAGPVHAGAAVVNATRAAPAVAVSRASTVTTRDRAQALGGRRGQVLERVGADDERRVGVAAREHRGRAQLARARARVPGRSSPPPGSRSATRARPRRRRRCPRGGA